MGEDRCYRALIWFGEKHKAHPRVKYCKAESEEEATRIISAVYPNHKSISVWDCLEKSCERKDIFTREVLEDGRESSKAEPEQFAQDS